MQKDIPLVVDFFLRNVTLPYFTGRETKPEKLHGLLNISQQIPSYCISKNSNNIINE